MPPGLQWGELGDRQVEQDINAGAAPALVIRRGQGLEGDEVPGVVEEPALQGLADRDVLRRALFLGPLLPLPTRHFHPVEQAGARSDVPGSVPELVQPLAVAAAALAVAGHTVNQQDVSVDVALYVVADVVLDGRAAVDVGADLGEDLVPGPADLAVEVAAQRPDCSLRNLV